MSLASLLLAPLLVAQTPTPPPADVVQVQQVRPLPGQLDQVPVFNSNSPELVGSEGILLSTFPPQGKQHPQAHLNYAFNGRFDVFAHHVFRAIAPDTLTGLYLGILLYNPGPRPVRVDVLQAASYLSQPDAPFIALPSRVENPRGDVFAGPGSRVMSDLLRGRRDPQFPAVIEIPAGAYHLLMNLPIPVATLNPPLNGRSTYLYLRSSGSVYAASLALLARKNADGTERAPTLEEWQNLLQTGNLSTPRDRPPTPLDATGQFIYSRVAGVSLGSRWQARLTDSDSRGQLSIPPQGQAFSYGLSTLVRGRLGTEQVQTAPMLVRYPDTALQAHGNYGVQYDLSLPLVNNTGATQRVAIALQTPIKEDTLSRNGLRFFAVQQPQTFFRGTVRVRYNDDNGRRRIEYFHLVQRRGQRGDSLAVLVMPAGDRRLVEFSFLYPPDATPPQVLTVETLPY
ncbi:MAG TPA: DUF3370 domain-containing protein [Synechococcales cyanobacterium M55_K2018_004]|nr:DUF3370 domain-containing protein [Synechococcales cyanobacterium M55_K2018_004]